ncbi:MAG: hypothetical protein H0T46_03045 [Deltaproteobacteria bacterium]|nr:hypothetical protein [Deltaproteobacteria bacterium]
MPELRYYSTHEETLSLVNRVAEVRGVRLVPEIPILQEPRLATFDRMTSEVEALLATFPVLQLEGAFTQHGLTFDRRESGSAAGTYFLTDNIGPRLRWFIPGLRDRELTPGSLNMLSFYRNPNTRELEPPSAELKKAFRLIGDTIKKQLVRHSVPVYGKIWIGARTLEEVKQGRLVVL